MLLALCREPSHQSLDDRRTNRLYIDTAAAILPSRILYTRIGVDRRSEEARRRQSECALEGWVERRAHGRVRRMRFHVKRVVDGRLDELDPQGTVRGMDVSFEYTADAAVGSRV